MIAPTALGPKVNGARHGMCEAGPIVMDDAERNPAKTAWARLSIGGTEFKAFYGSREGEEYGWEWFSWIEIGGRQWLVTIDPDTWVVRFGDCVQRSPYREAAHEAQSV